METRTLFAWIEELGPVAAAKLLKCTHNHLSQVKSGRSRVSLWLLREAMEVWGDQFDVAGSIVELTS